MSEERYKVIARNHSIYPWEVVRDDGSNIHTEMGNAFFSDEADTRDACDLANYADREARKETAEQIATLTARVAELEAVIREALQPGVFGRWQTVEDPRLKHSGLLELCERHGFGAVMQYTSHMWKQRSKHPGSEFTIGSCASVRESWIADAERVLGECETPAPPAAKAETRCKFCGSTSCYCCPECGENVAIGHKPDCSSDPSKPETTETPAFKPRRFVIDDESCIYWQTEPDGKIGFYKDSERCENSEYSLEFFTTLTSCFREVPIPAETPAPTCGTCGGTKLVRCSSCAAIGPFNCDQFHRSAFVPCPDCAAAEGGVA